MQGEAHNVGLERATASVGYRVFDEHAEDYDRWFTENIATYGAELKAVRHMLPRCGLGVEIGAGTGRFAAPLGVAIGIEPAWNMAKVAKTRGVAVCPGLGEQLPFRDSSVDLALLVTLICFVADVPRLLREVHRILKPRGRLINGFIDRDSPLGQAYEARKAGHAFYRHARFRSARDVGSYTQEAGFSDVRFCETIRSLPDSPDSSYQVRDGYGKGGFVVIAATKSAA